MGEYVFLFFLALVWASFAVVQDLRSREISNWLNFSLIAFALAYRGFYSIAFSEWMFFAYGILGVALFVFLGYVFYYGKIFAGGDAKLLMGIGAILPFEVLIDYLYVGGGFIFALFFFGSLYSLVFSAFIVLRNRKDFSKNFKERVSKGKYFVLAFVLLGAGIIALSYSIDEMALFSIMGIFVAIFPFLYFYVRSVEEACMIRYVAPEKLTEGDWIEKDIRVGKKIIRKSVHGLSASEIKLLRKHKKKVLIKDGIPFAPAFLFALAAFVYLWYFPVDFF